MQILQWRYAFSSLWKRQVWKQRWVRFSGGAGGKKATRAGIGPTDVILSDLGRGPAWVRFGYEGFAGETSRAASPRSVAADPQSPTEPGFLS